MNKIYALIFALSASYLQAHISEIDHLMQQALVAHNMQKTLEACSTEPVEKRNKHKRTVAEKDGLTVIRVDWDYDSAPSIFKEITLTALDKFYGSYPSWSKNSRDLFDEEIRKKGLQANLEFGRNTSTQCTYYRKGQVDKENVDRFIRCDYALPADFYTHLLILAKEQTAKQKNEDKK